MVGEELIGIVGNSEILSNNSIWASLPPEIISKMGGLITILKTAGIILIGYIIFLIIGWILEFRKYKRIKVIYKKIEEVNRKLDLLLKKEKINETKSEIKAKEEKHKIRNKQSSKK